VCYKQNPEQNARKSSEKDIPMSMSTVKSRPGRIPLWITILLLVAGLLLIVWGRVYSGSYQSYREGMVHLENRERVRAITYFDRSIHWYTPFNPWVQKSAERLWEIGQAAEKEGDTRLALIAYRTIRRGFFAARSVYQPGKNWIRRSEVQIERLVRAESGAPALPPQQSRDPDVFWSMMVLIGLFGWIGSMLGFIMAQWGPWRQREGRLGLRSLMICAFFAFLVLWFAGMHFA
jgi:hypothetical protein